MITRFLERLARRLNKIKPHLVRSAAVKPEIATAYEVFGQDWPRWIKKGILDLVLPMAYSTDPEVVYNQIEKACREVGANHVWAGLRAYDVPVSGVVHRVRKLAPLNLGGYSFFSYDGVKNSPLFFKRVGESFLKR
ncbi:MAG: hypothetical protein DRG82_17020 [Deltaproteobacteria bacterium]|nr:MAG: hypothetical protein DRG82_17020 [Deltaproteobacteria bacterium]